MYLNRIELIGFLGADAETKQTPNGKAVTSLSLATKTSWMKGTERQERTEWHRIQVWGKLGEYAAAFKKGAYIRVEGELRSREYEAETGAKVRTYEIVASTITNLRAGQRNHAQEPQALETPAAPEPEPEPTPAEPPAPKKTRKRSRKASEEARS
jgi:single-strand DNA-binding protein